jgi:hypothetical protein
MVPPDCPRQIEGRDTDSQRSWRSDQITTGAAKPASQWNFDLCQHFQIPIDVAVEGKAAAHYRPAPTARTDRLSNPVYRKLAPVATISKQRRFSGTLGSLRRP